MAAIVMVVVRAIVIVTVIVIARSSTEQSLRGGHSPPEPERPAVERYSEAVCDGAMETD